MKTERKSALIAGIALLIMAVVAAFTYGYIHNTLVISDSPETTFKNLKTNGLLFQMEILGWLLILILDVLVAWAIYVFFKNGSPKLSIIMAGLRVVYTVIFGVAIFNLLPILKIINGNVTEAPLAGEQILKSVESFETIWFFALTIFGFHLWALGILTLQSKNIHNFGGMLLVFAAVCYTVIHSAKFLLPEFENQVATAEMVLSLPMAFGEVGFAFWLIIRGGKPRIIYRQTKTAVTN